MSDPTPADFYPPLGLRVLTPRLELHGASDDLLARLLPVVRRGVVGSPPYPFDDPMSLYEESPQREWQWLRAIWRGRANVSPSFWRLYMVVMLEGEPIGMQDLIGRDFAALGTVTSFSWLSTELRGRGLGREMRAAILQLAFAGLGAKEAGSEAFGDNLASNRVSEALGYRPNGSDWATRRGEPALLNRWRLTREDWRQARRDEIRLVGVEACKAVLGLG